ncbi:MAG: DUF4268 domain-containing protein [Coriobacteriia bacterium]|nr:DUF4268 domain-containing protein [Coriobacteriia bacterium]
MPHTNIEIAKMLRIDDLRTVWKSEPKNFTNWLAEEDNLDLLGETIGLELELVETESAVGNYSADIIASEVNTGHKIVIENQLEDSNHDHLGKIITYASGKDASAVVWIVKHARDEHAQAIEWLNSHTDEGLGFFLLEIELWRIGDSKPAPRFNVVERPNDWGKAMKAEGLNETERIRLQYWSAYKEQADETEWFRKVFTPQKPSKNFYSDLHLGSSAYIISQTLGARDNNITVAFYVHSDHELFESVRLPLEEFAKERKVEFVIFGDDTKACGIRFVKKHCDIKGKPEMWPEFINWQMEQAIALREKLSQLGL